MFSAAATIFEGVGEVQSKFAKMCEREYEGLSSELKKWFKKMNVCRIPAIVVRCVLTITESLIEGGPST